MESAVETQRSAPQTIASLQLENAWDFYHVDPRQVAKGLWDPELISTFCTVHDFWCIFNNIVHPTYLPHNGFLYLFKHTITPKWEAVENAKGGELSVILDPQKLSSLDMIDDVWLHTLLALVGEYFTDSPNINGVCCSAKPKFVKISLWLNTTDQTIVNRVITEWANNLNCPTTDLRFKPFN